LYQLNNKPKPTTMKKPITQKEQNHYTHICKYCAGTGKDIFNKEEDCPNCVQPYEVISNSKLEEISSEERDQHLREEDNLGIL